MVKSNPNNFYVDNYGRVNEIENDEDRVVFGTFGSPRKFHNNPPNSSSILKEKE